MAKKRYMENSHKVVLVTGGFDPIHSGHIAYFESARELGDCLVVGLNSDDWLTRKKGRYFMPSVERSEIIKALKPVDHVILFDDSDGSAIQAIASCKELFPDSEIIFANGGDRTNKNIPEMVYDDVEYRFGVGGKNKKNSSSWILKDWAQPVTRRPWGTYRVIWDTEHMKVKELYVTPGKRLSMQRHKFRKEFWMVAEGIATVRGRDNPEHDWDREYEYRSHNYLHIDEHQWHQLINDTMDPLKIIEIQYGEKCIEEDIERINVPDDY